VNDIGDFVEEFLTPEKPPRDGSGRPLLIPRGVEINDDNRVPYTRASGLGDLLEEFGFLWKWKMRGLAKGLADRMDLIRLVAAEDYTCGFADDEQANRQAGRNIDQVIERAMDHAGVDMKADYGTAIHLRTEPGNRGTDPDEKQREDQESCWRLWTELGVAHIGTEVFTACDETMSAGTFDHLSFVPGYGIVVTDKKTSSKAKSSYDVQLGGYANSDVYDKETDTRMTLEEYIESQGWNPGLLNRKVGIVWWVKNGKTEPRFLDLENGFHWAKVAADIRDNRRPAASRVAPNVAKTIAKSVSTYRDDLLTDIQTAPSLDILNKLWEDRAIRAIWTAEHTAAAKARKGEL